jgi:hypothetical protein
MYCAPGLIFGDTWGVWSRFHVLRSRTHFRRCRGRRVPFSCFALPNSFSTVARASCPVFMFCAPGLVFGGSEGVVSRFHILRSRTRFGRYRGRQVPFSCFALPDLFSTVPRASGLVFMFCAPAIIIGGTEGVGSHFHVLLSRTHFGRYRGVGSRFHVLRSQTHFWWYRGRRVPFSYFRRPNSFSTAPEGVGSRFHVLRSRTRFGRF